jgi:MFS family permease
VRISLEKKPRLFYGWIVLAVIFTTILLGYAIRNTFSVFFPIIVNDFGWGRGGTALMFSVTIMTYGLVAPVAGSLVDKFGPRLVLPIGVCIMGGGLALCSLATAQWQFYLLYGILSAAGLSMVGWTPSITVASRWFVKKRGLVFGILGAGFGASLAAAPVAQYLISTFNWQTAYIIIGLFAIIVAAPLCATFIRGRPEEKGLFPDGLTPLESEAQNSVVNPSGKMDIKWTGTTWTLSKAVRTYHFWLIFLISFAVWGLAEQTMIAHEVYFFQDVGFTPMVAATIYSLTGVSFVAGTFCSLLSDRFGREKVFIPVCVLAAVAVLLLFVIKDSTHPWLSFLFAILFGLGLGSTGPILSAATADLFYGKHFGAIQGTVTLGFSLGGAISPWFAGFIHDRTGSYYLSFVIVIVSMLIAAVAMWLVAPRKVRPIGKMSQDI